MRDEGPLAKADPSILNDPEVAATPYSWYILAVFVLANLFAFMDRQILNLLVEPLKHDLKLTDVQVSYLMGIAFALFNTVLGLPIGSMVDRMVRVRVAAAGILVWSLATALCGTAGSFLQLFFWRVGVGAGESTIQPAAYSIIADCFPARRRAVAISIFEAGMSVGAGLALIVGAEIISAVLSRGRDLYLPIIGHIFSWQLVFFSVGLPGILVAVLVGTLKEPRRHGAVQRLNGVGGSRFPAVTVRDFAGYLQKTWRSFFSVIGCYCLFSVAGYGAGAWMPTFLVRTYGLSAVQSGRWLGIMMVTVGVAATFSGGVVNDLAARYSARGRMIVLACSGICTAPFLLAIAFSPSVAWAIALLAPMYLSMALASASWGAVITEIVPNQMRGLAVALVILLGNLLGMGLGPTLVALVTDSVFHNPASLRYSLAIVPTTIFLMSSLCGVVAVWQYRGILAYLKHWTRQQALT